MELTNMVMPYALEIVATLVIAVIGVVGAWVTAKIGQRTQLTNIGQAIAQVVHAAQLTVGELQQTTVDAWKEAAPDGKLTAEQIATLQRDLLNKTAAKLSAPVVRLLEATKTDVNAIITGAAENMISRM